MRGECKLPTPTGEGSLPISNHTMQRVAGSIWGGLALEPAGAGFGGDSKDGTRERGSRKICDRAQILWKNNFINLAIAAFLRSRATRVIAELHVIEFCRSCPVRLRL